MPLGNGLSKIMELTLTLLLKALTLGGGEQTEGEHASQGLPLFSLQMAELWFSEDTMRLFHVSGTSHSLLRAPIYPSTLMSSASSSRNCLSPAHLQCTLIWSAPTSPSGGPHCQNPATSRGCSRPGPSGPPHRALGSKEHHLSVSAHLCCFVQAQYTRPWPEVSDH